LIIPHRSKRISTVHRPERWSSLPRGSNFDPSHPPWVSDLPT